MKVSAAVSLAIVFSMTTSLFAQSGPPGPLAKVDIQQRLNNRVPADLPFLDEQGKRVRLSKYFGKRPVVLALVYYQCPMLCTQVLNGTVKCLRGIELEAGRDYEVVVVSFDPKETPDLAAAKKKAYLGRYEPPGGSAGWHFLTGKASSIDKLTDAAGFRYQYDPRTRQYAHASGIMVLTPQGRIARYFFGIDYPTRDLRLSLVEASANRIGSPVDRILLFCYHYDPKTGRYGLAILNLIRAAGATTVLGLGTFVAVSLRRDRRRDLLMSSTGSPSSSNEP
jgi:protein SCO1/2